MPCPEHDMSVFRPHPEWIHGFAFGYRRGTEKILAQLKERLYLLDADIRLELEHCCTPCEAVGLVLDYLSELEAANDRA